MMRRALLLTALSLMVLAPRAASAAGPVLGGGIVGTVLADGGDSRYSDLEGAGYKVGFEVGSNRFRHEWAFNQTVLSGSGGGTDHHLTLTGFSYQLGFMFLTRGFTPYIGAGVEGGLAAMREPCSVVYRFSPGYLDRSCNEVNVGAYLRPYGIFGLRGQFDFGLGLRTELVTSYYGNLVGLATNFAVSYTW
ncbi:MAG: hypothetical protein HY901_04340 [Deltaproteobacteria bacterium]|nr:hypothetical protein [Deltaproteobacteria bacterium]